jgi:hypothetical protein
MTTKSSRAARKTQKRTDGRRPLLVYLHSDVIKALKKAALDEDRNAYEITEDAVNLWLSNRKTKRHRG